MFFGGSIAKKILSSIDSGFLSKDTFIVEIGAHRGYLLADIVQFIYTLRRDLIDSVKFAIVEPFSQNRQSQIEYFKDSFGDAIELKHFKSLKELQTKEAFFVANEIFDAFACEVVNDSNMLFVDDKTLSFEPQDDKTKELSKTLGIQKGEIAIGYEEFAKDMSKSCDRFEFVTFDYGDMHPRGDFSLRVYDKHKVYPFFGLSDFVEGEQREEANFYDFFKKSDITYDVNFSHLIKAYEQNGAKMVAFSNQAKALVDFGIIELLEILHQNSNEDTYKSELNRVKTLIDPVFMGERFKMVNFRKE
jgi:SAM-dependent MidA family methyltransferase